MRTMLGAAACLVALLTPGLIQAQGADSYPSKPVIVTLSGAAGGSQDSETRIWAGHLSDNFGQQFVMDYKPGGGYTIGLGYIAKQKPDGYVIGVAVAAVPLVRLRYPDSGVDPVNGFEHISILHKRSGLLVVHPSVPIRNIKEYVAYAKANPGVLNFLSSGNGSPDHITGSWLMSATNTIGAMNFIHYKSGPVAYADLVAGRVHMASIPYSTTALFGSMVKTGKLINIGTTSLQRSPLAPDMPTLNEQGLTGFDVSAFVSLFAPPKTSPAIINKLHAAIVKISKLPQLQQQLGESVTITASTPEEARRFIGGQEDTFRKLGQELHINYKEE